MDDMNTFFQQQKVRDAVCESALHLNAGDYGSFLQMCDQKKFEYSIINFPSWSPSMRITRVGRRSANLIASLEN